MLNISDELKNIYKNAPYTSEPIRKILNLYFPAIDLTITNDKLRIDGFSLSESLCSENDLTLGSCEAALLEIDVMNVIQDLAGLEFTLTQLIGDYTMPLGTYTVHSIEKQNDRTIKKIIACDAMVKADIDVSAWYNSLSFPISVQLMRASLLNYLGIAYENQTLSNDTVMIDKTISPSSLIGRDILKKLCEINAGFGHITRENKFKVIQLSGLGLYPSEELYPSEDLFPSESGEYVTAGYMSSDYEEYIVNPITYVTIREDDEDSGVGSGTPGNNYIITGNFLLYGKSGAELQTIVDNIFLQVKNKYYRPHNTTMIGLPYMEVGDSVTIITSNDAIESFIFKRTLTGIQALKDNISASGNQVRDQKVSPATEMQQTKSKVLKIQKSVDQLSIDMTDMEEGLQSQITLTAEQLQTQITDNKNNADSQFTQQANAIALKVNQNGVISAINLSPETAKIESPNIQLEGIVTANSYFQVLLDGSIKAVNGEFSGKIKAATIEGEGITCTKDGLTTVIKDGTISTSYMGAGTVLAQQVKVTGTSGATTDITGLYIDTGDITCEDIICNTINSNSHTHFTASEINANSNTDGQIPFKNGINAAGWNWVNNNFVHNTSSDIRIKKNYRSLKELPLALYMEIKPYLFEYKEEQYDKGYRMGFMAQQVENAFKKYKLDPFAYNLVQTRDPLEGTNECEYVFTDGKVHYINYSNMHAWTAYVLQQVVEKVFPEVIPIES